jgi:hypothetical protein
MASAVLPGTIVAPPRSEAARTPLPPEGMRTKTWMNDRIRIDLGFGSDGRVVSKRASPVSSQSEEFSPRRFIRDALQKIGWLAPMLLTA